MNASDKPNIMVHSEKSMNKTLFDVKWIPCSARFVVLGNYPRQTGSLQVCEMTSAGAINIVSEVSITVRNVLIKQ